MASLEVGWHVRLLTGGKVTDVPGNLKVLQRRTTDEDNSMHITGPTSEFWMTFPTGWRVEGGGWSGRGHRRKCSWAIEFVGV